MQIWAASSSVSSEPNWAVLAWVRVLKLLTLKRLSEQNKEAISQQSSKHDTLLRKLVSMIPLAFGLTHIFACIMFYTGRLANDDGKTAWIEEYEGFGKENVLKDGTIMQQYLFSFYWCAPCFVKRATAKACLCTCVLSQGNNNFHVSRCCRQCDTAKLR